MKAKNLLAVLMTLSFANAYAQNQEQVLNSDPINVDGYLHEQNVTDGELESLKGTVKKYQNENKLYKEKTKELNKLTNEAEKIGDNAEEKIMANVEAKKAETRAMSKIKKAEAKLKCMMEDIKSPECDALRGNSDVEVQQVSVAQAAPAVAPVATSVAEAPVDAAPNAAFEKIKLLPYAGATQYNGEVEQLEAEISAGLRLESNITSRFSMGIGLGFGQLKTNDFASNQFSNMGWYSGYQNMYGGREIQYRQMGVDLYGKFFITSGERFRPYLGAGLGYNRANMKYTQNDTYTDPMYGAQFGNENYTTSFASGTVMAGTEIMITRGFGLNIEAAASSGLGSSLSSKSTKNITNSPDQQRLRELGNEIINANALSIFAGAVVIF